MHAVADYLIVVSRFVDIQTRAYSCSILPYNNSNNKNIKQITLKSKYTSLCSIFLWHFLLNSFVWNKHGEIRDILLRLNFVIAFFLVFPSLFISLYLFLPCSRFSTLFSFFSSCLWFSCSMRSDLSRPGLGLAWPMNFSFLLTENKIQIFAFYVLF